MCWDNRKLEALHYLQNDISQIVNHEIALESDEFRSLATILFEIGSQQDIVQLRHQSRASLFEELLKFFPINCKEPVANIVDMIQASLFS
jgi:hypothetical protein